MHLSPQLGQRGDGKCTRESSLSMSTYHLKLNEIGVVGATQQRFCSPLSLNFRVSDAPRRTARNDVCASLQAVTDRESAVCSSCMQSIDVHDSMNSFSGGVQRSTERQSHAAPITSSIALQSASGSRNILASRGGKGPAIRERRLPELIV